MTDDARIVGIDLSADPAKTGVVVLTVKGGSAVATTPEQQTADDEHLVALAKDATRVAVDCPLGWPNRFVDLVAAHREHQGGLLSQQASEMLRLRTTDRCIRDQKLGNPLSVSTERLGSTALRCARLQAKWAKDVWGGQPARRDGSDALVEAYPAAAMRRWDIWFTGYKSDQQLRETIVGSIDGETNGWLDLRGVRDRCIEQDDVLDALVCALVGVAALRGKTWKPSKSEEADAISEGWIHVPREGIGLATLLVPNLH